MQMSGLCSLKTVIQFVVVFFILQVAVIFIWYTHHAGSAVDIQKSVAAAQNELTEATDFAVITRQSPSTSSSILIHTNQYEQSLTPNITHTGNQESTYLNTKALLQGYHGVTYHATNQVPVLVIGAASFPGSRIVKYFHNNKISLTANEDSVNIQPDEVLWYRWEQLMKLGVSPQFKNYSDDPTVRLILKNSHHKAIVYIPTPCYSVEYNGLRTSIEQIENFILVLETNRRLNDPLSIVLVVPLQPTNPVCDFFKLSLLCYHDLYKFDSTVIQTSGLYGPWQSRMSSSEDYLCYVDDLAKHVQDIVTGQIESGFISTFECSETSKSTGQIQTDQWLEEYSTYKQIQSEDVIASSYFTTKRNAQYPIEFINNNYYFMENWFINIYKMNLRMMVLHDDLSTQFTSTFKKSYNKADFVKITDFKDYRPNDRRFLGYYDYILAHPEIRRMIFTDMRDVKIQNNPFEVMEVIGDYGYVGTDRPFKRTVSESDMLFVFRRCYGHTEVPLDYHNDIKLLGFLNAGTIGGSRHVLLTFLTRFLMYFQISNKDNCNMAIVEVIFHKFLFDQLYFGWPINAAFITNQPNIPGLAVSHKWE